MEIDLSKFSASVIAGAFAIGTAIYAQRKILEKTKLEHSLRVRSDNHQHKLTRYQLAFEITEKLSKRFILIEGENVDRNVFLDIKNELISWNTGTGPVLQKETKKAYRALLATLDAEPKADGFMSRNAKNDVWRKKNWLRGCLEQELKQEEPISSKAYAQTRPFNGPKR